MPELDFAILADRVSAEAGGVGYVHRGAIDTVVTPAVPAAQFLGLLFRVGFTRQECGRPHRFEVILQDVDGQRLMQASSLLEPVWQDDLPPHWRYNLLGSLNFPVPLPAYGLYSFELLINDTNCKTIQLRVQAPPDAETPPGDEPEGAPEA